MKSIHGDRETRNMPNLLGGLLLLEAKSCFVHYLKYCFIRTTTAPAWHDLLTVSIRFTSNIAVRCTGKNAPYTPRAENIYHI